jgi:hypothetical protein
VETSVGKVALLRWHGVLVTAPRLTAADDSGYEIDEADVICWGRSPECVARQPLTRPAAEKRTRGVRYQLNNTGLGSGATKVKSNQPEGNSEREKDRRV